MIRTPTHALGACLLALSLAACAHLAPAPSATTTAQRPGGALAANDQLNAIVWMQTSQEHALVNEEIFRAARADLPAALADPTRDALPTGERATALAGLPPAVIVDVDETMLDNSPYMAWAAARGGEFDDASWGYWARLRQARPMPGALAYAQRAAALGITVVYISNRNQDLAAATLDNLRLQGFPVAGPAVFMGLGAKVPDCEDSGGDKRCRRIEAGRHYRVLQLVGDQLGDFISDHARDLAGRDAAAAPYRDWFGQRWFLLPNPIYGGWENVLSPGGWRDSQDTRRGSKWQALDVLKVPEPLPPPR
jgi:acid phosphatase